MDAQISTANLSAKFEVEILPLGQKIIFEAGELYTDYLERWQCNSWCSRSLPVTHMTSGLPMAAVSVEVFHLVGKNNLGIFTVSMGDGEQVGALRLDAAGQPLIIGDEPNFWLEGKMVVKLKLTGTKEPMILISQRPVLLAGQAKTWPPFQTEMKDISGPTKYVPIDNVDSEPIAVISGGTITIGSKPSEFLSTDIPIKIFQYLMDDTDNQVKGVSLEWTDVREAVPQINHYHVFRRLHSVDMTEQIPWELVGEHIYDNKVIDATFDGSKAMMYKVRQVFIDPLGDEVMGCGTETYRVIPSLPIHQTAIIKLGWKF